MPSSEKDLLYIQTSLPELKKYLLSEILYYPLTGSLPRLTVGGLLLAQHRVGEEKLGTSLAQKLATVKTSWRVAWTQKSTRELEARLRLWRNYLNDYRNKPEEYIADYPHEIRLRVMIELLSAEADQIPDEITILDKLLRANFLSGEFIWDERLEAQFPEDRFWFLYGKLR
ncbi:MAG: hypothetical protein HN392_14165 [Anaerolineae bacterium]|jgi:hypothetical protein|nr:hypothetical protein [Anaerolineae bacterium]MBT7074349.1 hypothetical protein [Anaerolineae bacterium]MBT7781503.1 hypothetical protein [Anaerolineae bacterium]